MDIRELAKQAGFEVLETGTDAVLVSDPGSDAIMRFAALVQAAEREDCAAWYAEKGWLLDEDDVADAMRKRGAL